MPAKCPQSARTGVLDHTIIYITETWTEIQTKAILVDIDNSMNYIGEYIPLKEKTNVYKEKHDDNPNIIDHAKKRCLSKKQYPVFCIICLTFFLN